MHACTHRRPSPRPSAALTLIRRLATHHRNRVEQSARPQSTYPRSSFFSLSLSASAMPCYRCWPSVVSQSRRGVPWNFTYGDRRHDALSVGTSGDWQRWWFGDVITCVLPVGVGFVLWPLPLNPQQACPWRLAHHHPLCRYYLSLVTPYVGFGLD